MGRVEIYEPFSMRDFVRSSTRNSRVVRGHCLGERSLFGVKGGIAVGSVHSVRREAERAAASSVSTALFRVIRPFVPLFRLPRKTSSSALFSGKKA